MIQKWLVIIFSTALAFRLIILVTVPRGETPDELYVFRRIWSDNSRLNDSHLIIPEDTHYRNNVYFYPPLYFSLSAFFVRLQQYFSNVPQSFEQFFTSYYLSIRLMSFCLTVFSMFFLWKIINKTGVDASIKISTFIFIAFLPSLLGASVFANHNTLLFFLTFLFLMRLISINWSFRSYREAIFLGLITGLAMLTKFEGIFLLAIMPPYAFFSRKKGSKFAFLAIFGLSALVISGWWYAGNFIHFGWVYDKSLVEASSVGFAKPFQFENYSQQLLTHTFFTFFAVWGKYNNIFLGLLAYEIFGALIVVCLIGFVKLLTENSNAVFKTLMVNNSFSATYFTLGFIFLGYLFLYLIYNFAILFQPQGRYFFPSVLSISINIILGLSYWFRGNSLKLLPILVLVLLLFFNWWGFGCVLNYYYQFSLLPSFLKCMLI